MRVDNRERKTKGLHQDSFNGPFSSPISVFWRPFILVLSMTTSVHYITRVSWISMISCISCISKLHVSWVWRWIAMHL